MNLRNLQGKIWICGEGQFPEKSDGMLIRLHCFLELAKALADGAHAPVGFGGSGPQLVVISSLLGQPDIKRQHLVIPQ